MVADPNNQRTADGPTTIGIVVVTYPERLTAHFGGDAPTKAGTALQSLAHTNLPPSRNARLWPRRHISRRDLMRPVVLELARIDGQGELILLRR
jgi:hypothetical protein